VSRWCDSHPELRNHCPHSCGCCTKDNECVCENNEQVHKIASKLGAWWIRNCDDVLRYVDCQNPLVGKLVQAHCPCHCS
jgi:hypothetical protein